MFAHTFFFVRATQTDSQAMVAGDDPGDTGGSGGGGGWRKWKQPTVVDDGDDDDDDEQPLELDLSRLSLRCRLKFPVIRCKMSLKL